MQIRSLAPLMTCAALAACAAGMGAGPSLSPAQVQVYNSTQLVPTQYRLIEHIWIESGRSAFSYPTFRSVDDGIEAMKRRAAQAGASGLLNVMCLDATDRNDGKLLCYADAIGFN